MKRKQEFDWRKFHFLVHQAENIYPKNAEVNLEEKTVLYEFAVKACNLKNKDILFPIVDTAQFNAARGFVSALRVFCPKLATSVGDGERLNLGPGQIRTIYRARTLSEIGDILKYLRRVPARSKDIDKPSYFFTYD